MIEVTMENEGTFTHPGEKGDKCKYGQIKKIVTVQQICSSVHRSKGDKY